MSGINLGGKYGQRDHLGPAPLATDMLDLARDIKDWPPWPPILKNIEEKNI